MRRALSLLLITFLVLRGLVGTAMAAGMLPPVALAHSQVMATQTGAQMGEAAHGDPHAEAAHPSGHHGAMDHAAAQAAHCGDSEEGEGHGHSHCASTAAATPAPTSTCADGHGSTCTVCEICHATMVLPAAPPAAQSPAPTAAIARAVRTPANAPVALAHKPPIA